MAEVLSQSQIDALLSAVRSGEKSPEQKSDEPTEKKYRKYDFKSPRKFTKDRIKMLNGIFENYTRLIGSRLNGLLHINCIAELESIEEQKYYEFSNALTEGDILALAQVNILGTDQADPVMVFLSTSASLTMMDRMMGGDGATADEDFPSNYTYTDLELSMYDSLVRDLISIMGNSWENYIPLQFTYNRTEVNPTLVQLLGLDETIVIVNMRLQLEQNSGRMSICLPGTVLTNVFAEINLKSPGLKVSKEDFSESIFDELRDSSLDVVARLGETQLSLDDIYHLSVGDVIDLGRSKNAPVFLEIGGYQWFAGRIGTHRKNMAVKIDEVCYQAEQRSE